MKFSRLVFISLLAFATAAALAGCSGNSASPTRVDPALDTTAPLAPSGMSVVNDPVTGLDMLQWSNNTEPDLAKYQVLVYSPSPTRDNAYLPLVDVTGSNRMRLPVVSTGTTLYYRVRAVDTSGNASAASSVATVRLKPSVAPVDPPGDDPPPILHQ